MSHILKKIFLKAEENSRFIENGLCHIHIPKTAGTFLLNVLKDEKRYKHLGHKFGIENVEHYGYIGHYNAKWKYWPTYLYKKHFRKGINFSVVRSPVSWLTSYYSHHDNEGWGSVNEYHDFASFEEFCEAFLNEDYKFHLDILRKFQLAQCFDINDNCRVDFLVYNESIDKFLEILKEDYGFKMTPIIEKKVHVSKSKSIEISDGLEKRLLLYFSQHMSLFGYQADGSIDIDKAILDTDGVIIDPCGLKFSSKTGKIYLDSKVNK